MHAYEIRSRKDKRGVDQISDALLFWPSLATRESFLIAGWQMIRP
jgi:hypothetical protein